MKKYSDKYLDYLHSDKWKEQRAKAFAHDGNMCAICGSTEHLEGHHIRYGLMGTEQDWLEVLTVCHDCHEMLEEIKEKKRINELEPIDGPMPRWEQEAMQYVEMLIALGTWDSISEAIEATKAINRGEEVWKEFKSAANRNKNKEAVD